jgi:hypothetical protein
MPWFCIDSALCNTIPSWASEVSCSSVLSTFSVS